MTAWPILNAYWIWTFSLRENLGAFKTLSIDLQNCFNPFTYGGIAWIVFIEMGWPTPLKSTWDFFEAEWPPEKVNMKNIGTKSINMSDIMVYLAMFSTTIDNILCFWVLIRGKWVIIFQSLIPSVLEQCAVVWNSSITKGEQLYIERVQKCALRAILKEDYISYEEALDICNLETLKSRRNKLSLSFAIKCTKNENTKDIFPLRKTLVDTRNSEKYIVTKSCTDRLANSAVPFMQRLLNKHAQKKSK